MLGRGGGDRSVLLVSSFLRLGKMEDVDILAGLADWGGGWASSSSVSLAGCLEEIRKGVIREPPFAMAVEIREGRGGRDDGQDQVAASETHA